VLLPVIPPLRRLSQKDLEFEASLGYLARLCLKKKTTTNNNKKIETLHPQHDNSYFSYSQTLATTILFSVSVTDL
jgi:hypothetical protein